MTRINAQRSGPPQPHVQAQPRRPVNTDPSGTTTRLAKTVKKVNANSTRKAKIQALQKKFELLKKKIRQGGDSRAKRAEINQLLQEIQIMAKGLGLGKGELGDLLKKTPNRLKTQDKDVKDQWADWMQGVDRVLDGENQAMSELGQDLLLELKTANDNYHHYSKMRADISSRFSRAADQVCSNMKC